MRLTPYQVIFYNEWLQNPLRSDYNIVMDNIVVGDLNIKKMRESLLELLNKYLIFRHNVVSKEDGIYWIKRSPTKDIGVFHPQNLSDDEIYKIVSDPFDLEKDVFFRLHIIRLEDQKYRIVCILPHLVVDGISTEEIYVSWGHLYNDEDINIEPLEQQNDLHEKLTSFYENILKENDKKIHSFWKKHLSGLEGIDLSFLKNRKNADTKNQNRYVNEYVFSYEADICNKVRSLKYNYKITPYIFGQLVLAVLLHKITGQKNIGIPYPIAMLEGKELMYGAHVNTLIIDYRFDEGATAHSLINYALAFFKELKTTKAKYLPIYEIIKYADNTNIMDIGFAQTFPRDLSINFASTITKKVHHKFQIDLTNTLLFEQELHENKLNYRIRYYNDVLDDQLLENFISLYKKVFNDILNDLINNEGQKTILSYSLLTEDEELKLVKKWNNNRKVLSDRDTIVELFEDQVIQNPSHIAVVYNDMSLTYSQLDHKVNILAAYLRENYKIKSNDMVALYQTRSEHMLISILAVLKAGGAYVPIDPDTPLDRILYILRDTKSRVVLTNEDISSKIENIVEDLSIKAEVVNNKNLLSFLEKNYNGTQIEDYSQPDALAYVIYTSGTTGIPKGVMVEHKGVVNLALSQAKEFGLLPVQNGLYKKCLWYSNYVFDAHVSELYTAIANGHTLYIIGEDKRMDLYLLNEYINGNKIHIATIPPALLSKENLLNLETLVVAGDVTSQEIMDIYLSHDTKIINAYGPTEATVCSTLHHYSRGDINTNIGTPLDNTTAYILDKDLNPLPVGVIGELYIGGAGIARGYLNNPQLTAERFLLNPFQSEEEERENYNGRIYKTGDLARLLPNGELEYIGRNDFQVKIRGFRIEPGEIESALLSFAGIRQSIVLAKKHPNGTKYLVGYYVSDMELSNSDINNHLQQFLPEYMVPSTYIYLSEMPINVNGKIDRKALPEPDFTATTNYVSPANEQEAQLCQIYGQILRLNPSLISVEDDFFKLGGDSISCIQVVSRIRQQLNVSVSVKDILEAKTIRNLCKDVILKANNHLAETISEQGLLSGGLNMLPVQEWFFGNINKGLLSAPNHWNQTFILQVPELNTDLLSQSLNKLIEYHDSFRLFYLKDPDGSYNQFYNMNIDPAKLEVIDINNLPDRNQLESIYDSWQNQFDIDNGVLFHFGYVHGYADGSARIHFALHHLIVDAVSWRIIKNDLQAIYRYLSDNKDKISQVSPEDILGEKGTSYRQWVNVVKEYAERDNSVKEKEYWKSITGNIPDYNSLLSSIQTEFAHQVSVKMNAGNTSKLLYNIHSAYNTQPNDVLIDALSEALVDLTKVPVNYITLEGHGRENISDEIDVNNTVGWFTTMYPVELSYSEGIDTTIVRTKDELRSIPANGIGYGTLCGYTNDELPKIGFNYLGQFDESELEGWTFVRENAGLAISHKNKDYNILSINCGIIGGELHLYITGNFAEERLIEFAQSYVRKIEKRIIYLESEKKQKLTLADINFILSYQALDKIQSARETESVYLANNLQQGFIYHSISQGEIDDAYRTQMLWEYHNELEIEKLKEAWEITQQKYPSLRLRFSWEEELVQIIDKTGCLDWRYISGDEETQQQELFDNILEKDRAEPYDLSAGSLFRIYIIKRKDNYYHCIFSSHHAILDGWSNPLIIQYVHQVYISLLNNKTVSVVPDTAYLAAQNYLQNNRSEYVEYWENTIKRIKSNEDLTSLLSPQKKNTNLNEYKLIEKWGEKKLILPSERYDKLKDICSKNGLTVNAVLQYCWHKQLSIYTTDSTTVVGMIASGRDLPVQGIFESVGLYINTLPVIMEHTDEPVITLIRKLQDTINEANTHSNINLAEIQKEGKRLFNSLFVFENYPIPEDNLDDKLNIKFIGAEERQDYPLVVTVFEHDGKVTFSLKYAAELFDENAMEQMMGSISYLLDQLFTEPQTKANNLLHISPDKFDLIINKWNSTEQPYSADKTTIQLFEECVEKYPDKVALIYEDTKLSYKDLNNRANILGAYLKETYNIEPEDLIGLLLDRSETMIISILAIWKAGGAYVPIEPGTPDERISYLISDANIRVLLANDRYRKKLGELFSLRIEYIDDLEFTNRISSSYPADNFITDTLPESLAYVIYTSGTTGKPKGVMIEHRSINRLIKNSNFTVINENDNVLSLSGYQFDGSVYDFFYPLTSGATLVLSTKEVFLQLEDLDKLIEKHDITNFFVTTALFNTIVDAELPHISRLKYILFGGELVSVSHVNKFRETYKDVKLVHVYGPTETTTYATSYLVNDYKGKFTTTVPIGKSISNTTTYVLDSNLLPVPIGATGELYLGGAGLARGYLNNPELTSERFITNPYQNLSDKENNYNGHIYKTGDLVRYLPDGNIEYVGRNDFQVKIRGFRIELAEVESVLLSYQHIKQCIVLDKQHASGTKYLAAYYISDTELHSQDIYQYMAQTLPDYMIPSALVYMKDFPLNANGKVDRQLLPDPQFTEVEEHVMPENDMEIELCRIYSEILGLDKDSISVEEDFFRLGGNSILAIKLVSKINKELDASLHISSIFNFKTIRQLSAHILLNTEKAIAISKIEVAHPEQQILSFAQERLWFIENYEGGSNAYNVPMVFSVGDTVHLTSLEQAIAKVVERHEVLRSYIKANSSSIGYQQLIETKEHPFIIEYIRVDSLQQLHNRIDMNVNRVFELGTEYPIHTNIYELNEKLHVCIVVHHIAFDGWSTDLFINEIYNLYNYFECIRHNNLQLAGHYILPEVPVQYKDYALWQRNYLSGERLQTQINYWKKQLTGYETLELITDKVRPSKIDYTGKDIPFSLDKDTSEKLRGLAKELNVSLYSLLLSGYYLLLSAFSNQHDIVVGTPMAGRHYPEISETIGFFVNTLALRQSIDVESNIVDFVYAVGQQISEAQQYQDLPFEKLVDELNIEKDLSRHPIFQVMFGVQSFGRLETERMPYPLDIQIQESNYEVAKFDVTTMMDDSQNEIKGYFNYAVSLFDEGTIRNYINTFCFILKQISSIQPKQELKIKDLHYLSREDYQEIVHEWNNTRKDFPSNKTLIQLFEEQVELTPDNIAVAYQDTRLTYRELNRRVNQLAAYIRENYSIGPDDFVNLYLSRSHHMAIAILAVMKAGGAYVPMDIEAPDKRILYLIEDTKTKVILTDAVCYEKLKITVKSLDADTSIEIVDISNPNIGNKYPEHNLVTDTKCSDLAYLIYTSGTTGKPKGVMVEHMGVVNTVTMQGGATGMNSRSGDESRNINCLWFANYIFDAHVCDFYIPILNGHTVHIVDKEICIDLSALNRYIVDHSIELALVSPAILEKDHLLDLKNLIVGGESTNAEIMHNYKAKGHKIFNAYGPTEISVCSNIHDYEIGDSSRNIGRPIHNSTSYVLDANLRPLPVGAIGELYIGGIGVTRGYLNNTELTKERFLVNPFQTDNEKSENYNDRIYKSGDLVRYLPNGDLEYLGRNDFQVKIRGLRIELGEIETILTSYPSVKQTVVLAKEHSNGSKYLIGYYVADKEINQDLLAKHLFGTLPDYMIPSVFVHINELPRTPNGKIDRKALPDAEFVNKEAYVAPVNESEEALCNIFGEILGIKASEIGVEDDFFHLGGDSIKSMQLVNRIQKQLDIHIGIKDIFNYKSIRNLYINVVSPAKNKKIAIKTEQGIIERETPLLPVQKWFFRNLEEGKLPAFNHWNQALMIKVPVLDADILERSFSILIEQHDTLRLTYKKEKFYSQYYQSNIGISFDRLDVKGLSENDIEDTLTGWQSNFDIFEGRLFHAGYLEGYDDGSARIHIAAHHLAVDGVSWRIISNDLRTIYNQLLNNPDTILTTESILGRKGSSYRQWSQAISGYENEEDICYWESVTEGVKDNNLILSGLKSDQYNKVRFELNDEQTDLLLRKINHVYGTQINDILLTAFAQSLSKLTGSRENYILLEGHGRENIFPDLDINNTTGWFTCMYPVKLLYCGESPKMSLISVKDTLRKVPNNGIGYGAVVGYDKAELPLVAFNYLGRLDTENSTQTDWSYSSDNAGLTIAKQNMDINILNVNGAIASGKLSFIIEGYLCSEQIDVVSQTFRQSLEGLIGILANEERNYKTLSDIDFLIGQKYLDKLQSKEEIDGIYLANSLQQGFIYHSLSQGYVDDAYHTQMVWDYLNPVDPEKLKQSILISQQRFETLRLRFAWDDELVQIIGKRGSFDWKYKDITAYSSSEQDTYVNEIIEQDKNRPYNLAEDKLFRVYLLKKSEAHYTCIFSNHHAILDGWSGPVIINYIHDCYLKLLKGETIVTETDNSYSSAQRYLQDNRYANKEYWDNRLQLITTQEDLSTLLKPDKRHVNLSDYKHVKEQAEKSFVIKGEEYDRLKKICKEQGFTLSTILHYCWHKQLNIYDGGDITVVGMTLSGRNIPVENIEQSAGLYINTLPIILEHKDERVVDTIKNLQGYINEANSRCDINLSQLQKGGVRLFNTLFVYENYPTPENKDSDILQIEYKLMKEKLDYPLGVSAYEQGSEINFQLKYAAELFAEDAIIRLLDGVKVILEQITDNQDLRASDLVLMTKEEYRRIVYDWNNTIKPYPSDRTIVQLFEEQVEKTPDNPALVFDNTRLTYRQLNERSNKLAAYIRSTYNISPDDLVALCLNKSENILISILAVLKAGGAYVPLDPEAPDERILYMIEDTRAKAVLTTEKYEQRLNTLFSTIDTSVQSIDRDDFINYLECTYSSSNLDFYAGVKDLAYVIYTSGTTGKPKGVMLGHKGITNLAIHMANPLKLGAENGLYKNVLWYSNYVFDAHVYELYPAISHGYCIHILDEEKRMNLALLKNYIEANEIAISTIPPALLDKNDVLPLEVITVAGEVTSLEVMNSYVAKDVRIVNGYGPTETTVCSNYHVFEPGDINTNIGKALANTTLYVLNSNLQPIPVGAVGELYIGGDGIAQGYLNNKILTKERFIVNPFQTPEEKISGYNPILYKTGDLVRYLPTGDLEYISRNDFQVKINGLRIELGEIETVMSAYPGIKQCVVLDKVHVSGTKYLVGYYISDTLLVEEEIHNFLSNYLPQYMVPSVFVKMDSFPLTVNGKLDRKALVEPKFTPDRGIILPENDVEVTLCNIYSDVLGLDANTISVEEDFFRLGGNSILAIKLMGRINKELGKELHISAIFDNKTIRQLSKSLLKESSDNRFKIELIPVDSPELHSLSFSQERLWFIENLEGGSNAYNIPIVFSFRGPVNISSLKLAIHNIILRHEVLRSFIRTNSDGVGYQELIDIDQFPFQINYCEVTTRIELEEAIRNNTNRIFSLDKDYPIAVGLFMFEGKLHVTIVVHHIAFDGWSVDILVNELLSHYNYYECQRNGDMLNAEKYILPDIDVQYKDFALWQRNYLSGDRINTQIEYWKKHLANYETLNLVTDRVRPSKVDYTGEDIFFSLDREVSQQLRSLAKELSVSLYSLLLGGYYLLLSSYSNQKDILIGTSAAGRHHPQISNTIGFFVNMLVLRHEVNSEEGLVEYIKNVGKVVTQAQQNQDLPFEKLVSELNVEKDLSRHPVFQIMFGLQSFGRHQNTETDYLLDIELQDTSHNIAKFDITTMMDDSEEVIKGMFNYATSLFEESTICNYIDTYKHILGQFAQLNNLQEETKVRDILYLNEEGHDIIIRQWNETVMDYPSEKTLVNLFEDQVKRTPENIAVIYEDISLTYSELNSRANRLAAYLKDCYNIQPDDLVTLCLDRSENLLVAILAVLKAGGAYVPMDTHAPDERLIYMVRDTETKLVLTGDSYSVRIKDILEINSLDTIGVEAVDNTNLQEKLLNEYLADNISSEIDPHNLAYIIYTSGTTGNPKGVMVEHRSVVNRIFWMNSEYPLNGTDKILQKTTYTFDVSVWELFWANWTGATIVLAHPEEYKDNVYLLNLIEKENITVMHFVPSMLAAFEETLLEDRHLQSKTQSLRYSFCSGEALTLDQVKRFHQLVPQSEIHNLYGPTEATVDVLYYDCNDRDISKVLIGKPIFNTTAYVLDANLRLLPAGAIGELYIGGDNIARGYLNNGKLTKERFLSNPFQMQMEKDREYNSVIYKTGDLVRILSDGNIEYIGRNDFQVKIRGLRIELGEIENQMLKCDGIRQSIILSKKQHSGNMYLVGYYVADTEITDSVIRDQLNMYLPEYMIPSIFVHLAELPLTLNGKLDRKALPDPDFTINDVYVSPETETERGLCNIYGEILELDASAISAEDDFFRLGGNSILVIKLISKIKKQLNTEVKLLEVLNTNSLRSLAKIIDNNVKYEPIIELNKSAGKEVLLMIHPAMSGCQIYSSLATSLSTHYHCYGVDSYNLYNTEHICDINALAQYYLDHIEMHFGHMNDYKLLGWSLGGQIALEIAFILEQKGVENISVYLLDSWLINTNELESVSDKESALKDLNITDGDGEGIKQLMCTESKLSNQPVSGMLKHTNIVLFKATENNNSTYHKKYPLNNIDSCIARMPQLKVIDIKSEHITIINHREEIAAYIIKDK